MEWLTTREAVKAALDIAETARADQQVDRAIASASETVEGHLHRRFRPRIATRYFRWPGPGSGNTWTLRLDANELITVTTLTAGGVEIPSTDYFLEPNTDGPPFTRIEIDTSSSSVFDWAGTPQRAIAVTGLWGYRDDSRPAGALDGAVADPTATTVTVTDGSRAGVGDVLQVGAERLIVTDRGWSDTGATLAADLTAQVSGRTVAVSDGSGFSADEVLLIGSEVVRVVEVAGDNLTCRRAWDGSVLAAHTSGATIYASRQLTVTRGALGSTASTHADGDPVTAHVVPGAVEELVLLEALVTLGLGRAGGAAQAGQGPTTVDASGGGVATLRWQVWESHGRKARMRSV